MGDSGDDSPYEERARELSRAYPFGHRAYLNWRDFHRTNLKALEATLVSRLGLTGDAQNLVHETLREFL